MTFQCPHNGSDMPCMQCDNEMLVAENKKLRNQLKALHDATIVLRNGMGGHNHWDSTMQHGAGCETCIRQREAREEAHRLIESAEIELTPPEECA